MGNNSIKCLNCQPTEAEPVSFEGDGEDEIEEVEKETDLEEEKTESTEEENQEEESEWYTE